MKNTLMLALFACAFLLGQGQANAQDTKPQFRFMLRVETQGIMDTFAECTGMGSQSEVIEHKILIGPGREVIRKIPGRLTFTNITCRRAVTNSKSVSNWRKSIEEGKVDEDRSNGEIILMDARLIEIARWSFSNAWPASLTINEKDFREELVLTVEGIERVH